MGDAERLHHLAGLPERLAGALAGDELVAATELPSGAGIVRRLEHDSLRVGGRVLRSPLPRVVLDLVPSVDARSLADAWALERPVALSGDVHQRTWHVEEAVAELPDPYARRVATEPIRAGRWDLRPELADRPPGPLPSVVAGASPAYDVREHGGEVLRLTVTARPRRAEVVPAGHPDARALLGAMAALRPAWRGGWTPDPSSEAVVIYADGGPVAGATLTIDESGTALASWVCVAPAAGAGDLGSALIETLEAVAVDRGGRRLRLDASVFLHGPAVPLTRHGYLVGPPYDGDADGPVWAERELAVA